MKIKGKTFETFILEIKDNAHVHELVVKHVPILHSISGLNTYRPSKLANAQSAVSVQTTPSILYATVQPCTV